VDPTVSEPPLQPRAGGSSATEYGRAVGTPAHMSPEQAAGRLDQLGPATDVYSLGATLYELLTGRPAFGTADLAAVRRGAFPPPPQVQPRVPRALAAACRKAMALKPEDRYGSALDLAADIEQWLADEPVTAWREPVGPRLRRWVRKHARLVTGIAAALAVGVAALGGLAWQRERARRAVAQEQAETVKERDAKEAARAAAVTANDQAQARLQQVERANEILASVFVDLNPKTVEKEGKPLQAVLGERLDRATAAIEGEAIGDALAVARMQMALGSSQRGLGYPDKAIRLFTRARATLTARLGPDHPDTLRSMDNLATSYQAAGRLGDALPLFEETLTLRKAKLGPDHPDTLRSMNNLALGYYDAGKPDLALPLFEEALQPLKARLGPDNPDTLSTMNNLALSYAAAGKLDRDLPLFEEAARGVEHRKFQHEHAGRIIANTADCLEQLRRFAAAEAWRRKWLAIVKERAGPDAPAYAAELAGLGGNLLHQRNWADAEPMLREGLTIREKKQPDEWTTFDTMSLVGGSLLGQQKNADAEPLLRAGFAGLKQRAATIPPPSTPRLAEAAERLARLYEATGQPAEAAKWRAELADVQWAIADSPPKP
jgi:tetratricopeptide (TPR) repeat protein